MRMPPPGTVAHATRAERQWQAAHRDVETGIGADGHEVAAVPEPLTAALLERGRDRFEIVCATCHGLRGDGAVRGGAAHGAAQAAQPARRGRARLLRRPDLPHHHARLRPDAVLRTRPRAPAIAGRWSPTCARCSCGKRSAWMPCPATCAGRRRSSSNEPGSGEARRGGARLARARGGDRRCRPQAVSRRRRLAARRPGRRDRRRDRPRHRARRRREAGAASRGSSPTPSRSPSCSAWRRS